MFSGKALNLTTTGPHPWDARVFNELHCALVKRLKVSTFCGIYNVSCNNEQIGLYIVHQVFDQSLSFEIIFSDAVRVQVGKLRDLEFSGLFVKLETPKILVILVVCLVPVAIVDDSKILRRLG